MKTKIMTLLLLGASALGAAPRFSFGIGIGVGPRYYAPAPVYVAPYAPAPVYAVPPSPGYGYTWVGGYWGPRHVWRPGYWAAPRHEFRYRR
jgi:hypothetical protein